MENKGRCVFLRFLKKLWVGRAKMLGGIAAPLNKLYSFFEKQLRWGKSPEN